MAFASPVDDDVRKERDHFLAPSFPSPYSKGEPYSTCIYSLSGISEAVTAEAGTNQVTVTTGALCAWTAVSNVPWLTLTSASSGTGSGSVSYSYTENTGLLLRTGILTIAGQTYSVVQAPVPCLLTLASSSVNVTSALGTGRVQVTASRSNCLWTVVSNVPWLTLTSASSRAGSGSVSYSYTENTGTASRTGILTIAGQTYSVVQSPAPCLLTLALSSIDVSSALGVGSVSFTASRSNCPWTATSNVPWLTLTSASSGSGSGIVAYSYTENTGTASRTGLITIAGQTYSVLQAPAPCLLTLALSSIDVSSVLGTGSVSFTASRSNCPWTATSNVPWLTLTSASSGSGSGSVDYSYTENTGLSLRTGLITIAGQTYSVVQSPAPCLLTLALSSIDVSSALGTGSVSFTASRSNCPWTATSDASWLTLTSASSGSGSGSVAYSYTENTGTASRTGLITIAGQTYSVVQSPAPCLLTLALSSIDVSSVLGTGSVSFTASRSNCPWTASSDASWLTLTSASSGSGSGSVAYSYTENTGLSLRTGLITIAGQTYSVVQSPSPCLLTLALSSIDVSSVLGTGSVSFTTSRSNCPWTASSDASWLTFTSASSGSGSGSVAYSYTENTGTASRTGLITIAGQTYSVVQSPSPCLLTLALSSIDVSSVLGTGSVSFTASRSNCPWTASSDASWLTFTSASSGSGSGSVAYSYTENTGTASRTGLITIAGQTYSVVQSPSPCLLTLALSSIDVSSVLGTGSVSFTASRSNCPWTASSDASWLTLTSASSGSGSGSVAYSYTENTGTASRTGLITIAGQTYSVVQSPAPCLLTLALSSIDVSSALGVGSVSFTASRSNCPWTASSDASWLTLTSASSGSGSGIVGYSYTENTGLSLRTGLITIAGQTYSVVQSPAPCLLTLALSSIDVSSALGTGSVSFTTSRSNCPWTASSDASWLTLTSASSGSGSGSVGYSYTANPGLLLRTGTISIAYRTYTVVQYPAPSPCLLTLALSSIDVSSSLGTGSVSFTTSRSNCPWTASSDASWLTFTSASSGSGSGSVSYSYTENTGMASRTGMITIAGQTYSVVQSPAPCLLTLALSSIDVSSVLGTGSVSFTTSRSNCPWTASSDASWLTLTSASSGSGSGIVAYSYTENTGMASRTGMITIAGQTYSVVQSPSPCLLTLALSSIDVSSVLGTGSVSFTTSRSNCPWTASSDASWLTLTSASSGSGSGIVAYSYTENTGMASRTGMITIAGQTYSVVQSPSPCLLTLALSSIDVSSVLGTGSVSFTTSRSNCPWTASSDASWLTLTSASSGSGSGSVAYSYTENTGTASRTGLITIAGQTYSVSQSPSPCLFALASSSENVTSALGTGSVSFTASRSNCPWTASSDASWLTLTSASSGTGSGSVSYSYTENTGLLLRTGILTIAGQTYSVVQAPVPCLLTLASSSVNVTSALGTGRVQVTASRSNCLWTVVSNVPWLTLTSASSRAGSGSVSYSYTENTGLLLRTGILTIAGQTYSVVQSPAPCLLTLALSSIDVSSALGVGSVSFTASRSNCPWTATSNVPWLTLTSASSGSGSGSVAYSYTENTGTASRTGILTIAGQTYSVVQSPAPCLLTLALSSIDVSSALGVGSVSFTASRSNCPWTATSNVPWLTLTSASSGSGSGSVAYSYTENTGTASRTGILTIAGQTYSVVQSPAPCLLTLALSSIDVSSALGVGSVSFTASRSNCPWTATSNVPWLTLTSASSGSGSGSVAYSYTENTGTASRTGLITIAGQTYSVVQSPAPCLFALASSSENVTSALGTGSVSFTTSRSNCPWTASSDASWLTLTSASSGSGSGIVAYSYTENTGMASRTGLITIAGQTYSVSQSPSPCLFALASSSENVTSALGTGSVSFTASRSNCPWTASSDASWLTLTSASSGSGSGSVSYSYTENTGLSLRTGLITIAGQTYSVVQSPAPCLLTLALSSIDVSSVLGTGSVSFTTSRSNCPWTASSDASWLTFTSASSGSGSGSVGYSYTENTGMASRTGMITIAGQTYSVVQAPVPCLLTLASSSVNVTSALGTGRVQVTASRSNCLWTVVSNVPWLTLTSASSRAGSGSVSYSYTENTGTASRTGILTIAGQTYSVVQSPAPCLLTLALSSIDVSSALGVGSVSFTASRSNCPWTATSNVPWLTLTSASSGSGSGIVGYSYTENTGLSLRTGLITIAGQTYSVVQSPAPCLLTLALSSIDVSSVLGTGSVSFTTSRSNCPWTATSNVPWLTLTSASSGTGSGIIGYSYTENTGMASRTGMITIAGQTYSVVQSPAPCLFALASSSENVTSALGTGSVSFTASRSNCPWTASSDASWLTLTSASSGSGSGSVSYSYTENTGTASRTGLITIAGQTYSVVQSPSPCLLTLALSSIDVSSVLGTGSVSFTTSRSNCPWTATSNVPWLTLTSASSGSGSGSVAYSYTENTGLSLRTGLITIAGQTYSVLQAPAPCLFALASSSENVTSALGTGSVSFTASRSNCPWTASSDASWLTLTSASSGSGSGSVAYSYTENTGTASRTGLITIAGQTYSVVQSPAPCLLTLALSSIDVSSVLGTGSVSFTASRSNCPWTASSDASWLTLTSASSGSGSGSVAYSYTENTGMSLRTGLITIAGQTYSVVQAPSPCLLTLALSSIDVSSVLGTGSVSFTTSRSNCPWTASSDASWLTLTSASSGSGSGSVAYSYTENTGTASRTGLITIAGQTYSVVQSPSPCLLTLALSSIDVSSVLGTGSVSFTTSRSNCPWTATSNVPWLTLTSASSGSGSGSVAYSYTENTGLSLRTGLITIAGQTYSVSQSPAPCLFALASSSENVTSALGTGSVSFTASRSNCPWTASSDVSWLTLTSASSGSGSGSVAYSYTENTGLSLRTGLITIAGQTYSVVQSPSPCLLTLALSSIDVSSVLGTGSVSFTTSRSNCPWTATSNVPWLTLTSASSGSGSGSVAYSYTENTGLSLRTGLITIAGQTYSVVQSPSPCLLTLALSSIDVSSVLGTGSVSFTASRSNCPWTASSDASWLTLTSASSGSGSGSVAYSYTENTGMSLRTGLITIAGQTYSVVQAPSPCLLTLALSSIDVSSVLGTGSVSFTTSRSNCPWTASSDASWLTLTSASSGSGSGSVAYSYTENTGTASRTGLITIAGQTYSVVQSPSPCLLTLALSSIDVSSVLGTGSVSFTTSRSNCPWTATSNVPWLTLTSASSGSGSGSVAYSYTENTGLSLRTGLITIAGQTYSVVQSPAPCLFALASSSENVTSALGTGSVSFTASRSNCPWTASSDASWLTLTSASSGSGSGSVAYSYTENTGTASRTGLITIAGQTYSVVQSPAPCLLTLALSSIDVSSVLGTGSVSFTASRSNCPWTATSNVPWLTLTSASSGSGSGSVAYSYTENTGTASRTGLITIAGQTYSVVQSPAPCLLTLALSSIDVSSVLGTGSISFTASRSNCPWTASSDASWLTLTSASSGSGSGSVAYSYTENTGLSLRTGLITIAGQTYSVVQAPSPCLLTLALSSIDVSSVLGTGSVSFTTSRSNCPWTASSDASWLTLTSASSGSGSGSVAYSYTENTGLSLRTGLITIAGQTYSVVQAPSPCLLTLALSSIDVSSVLGTGSVSFTTSRSNCPWMASSDASWLTLTSASSGSGSGSVAYSYTENTGTASRTGLITIAGQTYSVVQAPSPCLLTLALSSIDVSSVLGTGSVSFTASRSNCPWTASSDASWLTFTSASSGSGSGSVAYSYTENTGLSLRTGLITIAGQTYSVVQAPSPCLLTLALSSIDVSSVLGTGSVSFTASRSNCPWTASSDASWLTLTSASSGSGSGSVAYSYTANPGLLLRTGTISIADRTYTVVQYPASCSFTLASSSINVSSALGTGRVHVIANRSNCPWTASSDASWLTLTSASSGSGSGSVAYSYTANPGLLLRTGTISIADRTYTVVQYPASCSFTLASSSINVSSALGTGRVHVIANRSNCPWTASSNAPWLTLTSASSGSGSGSVDYSYTANPGLLLRTGTISIADRTYTVVQYPASCSFTLASSSIDVSSVLGTGRVHVIASRSNCPWTASSDASWLTLTSASSGSGSGSVAYSYTENTGTASRTGLITIAGQTYSVVQSPSPCLLTLALSSIDVSSVLGTGSVSFTTSRSNCPWTASSDASWLTLTSASSGSGSGSVAYSYTENTGTASRTGLITIAGQTYSVVQAPSPCLLTLALSSIDVSSVLGTGSVSFTASRSNCPWTASSDASWLTLTSASSGSGSGSVAYSYTENTGLSLRTGLITIAGQTYSVVQAPAPCLLTLALSSIDVSSVLGTGSVSFTASRSNCPWTASSDASWLTLTSASSGSGSGSVAYSYTENTGLSLRTGLITIAGQTYSVVQAPSPCLLTLALSSIDVSSVLGTGSVSFTTSRSNCPWTASSDASWLTFTSASSGSGSGSVAYSYTENTGLSLRTGLITIAGQTYSVVQSPAPCLLTLALSSIDVSSVLGTGSVSFTASRSNCPWTASSDASWLTLTSASSGSGSGSVAYSYTENTGLSLRTGLITIAGQTYSVVQAPSPCLLTLALSSIDVSSVLGTGSVSFTTSRSNCPWTASSDASWLTLTSASSGSGSGSVAYSYTENTGTASRTGLITIAGQTYSVVQAPAPCLLTLALSSIDVSSVLGTGSVSFTTSRSNCPWTASSDASWLTLTSASSGSGSGSVAYSYTENTGLSLRTGLITIAGQTYSVVQAPAPCLLTLALSSIDVSSVLGTGSVSFTTSRSNCPWTASSDASWLTFTSASSGSGSGSVAYSYTANPGLLLRTGTISIADRTYTVVQYPASCSFTLASSSINVSSALGTGRVHVIANRSNCPWTASSDASWLTLTSASSGSGSGSVDYSYTANPGLLLRTGTISIADRTYTVVQYPASCSFTLASSSINVSSALGTGRVHVIANRSNCPWTASSNAPWLTLTSASSGSGSGSVDYSYTANPGLLLRTGTISIADRTYTVVQYPASCSFTLASSSIDVSSVLGTGRVHVIANRSNCPWTASSNAPWLTLTSASSGSGSGSVDYSYTANPGLLLRTGTISIADRTYTVVQYPASCSFTLASSSIDVSSVLGTGRVHVIANRSNCSWMASSNAPWLTLTSGQSGSGSGIVAYSYTANPGLFLRTGTISIADRTYTVVQYPASCSFTLASSSIDVSSVLGTGRVHVIANRSNCSWMASSNAPWLTLTSGQSGSGSGIVAYSYTANPGLFLRTGTISIADRTYTVVQYPAPCLFTLASSSIYVSSALGTGRVHVTASRSNCPWTATSNVSWLTFTSASSGSGSGSVAYSYTANVSRTPRVGTITIAGQAYVITQGPVPCTYSLAKSSVEVIAESSTGRLEVTTESSCRWTAASNLAWITVTPVSGEGNGEVTYSIAKNTGAKRTGIIVIAGQTFTLTQAAIPCSYSLPTSSTTVPSIPGTSGVNVTASLRNCSWTATSNVSWLTLTSASSGIGSGSVSYAYTANVSRTSREGTITIAGQAYTVTQVAAPCTYSLTQSSVEVTGEASTGRLGVTTQSSCRWTAASDVAWITVTPVSGEDNGEVTYSIAKNTGVERTGTVVIAGQTFTVKQTMVTGFEIASQMKIFPNPAREYVTLDFSSTDKNYASLKIANQAGQVLYEWENPHHKMQIPLKGLSSGLYFIILQGDEKAVVQKLIVE